MLLIGGNFFLFLLLSHGDDNDNVKLLWRRKIISLFHHANKLDFYVIIVSLFFFIYLWCVTKRNKREISWENYINKFLFIYSLLGKLVTTKYSPNFSFCVSESCENLNQFSFLSFIRFFLSHYERNFLVEKQINVSDSSFNFPSTQLGVFPTVMINIYFMFEKF